MGHVRRFAHLRELSNTCLIEVYGRKCPLSVGHMNAVRGFRTSLLRKSRQSHRSSRSVPKFGQMDAQFEGVKVESGPIQFSKLWKPLCFTAVVGSGSFACATIWQYENVRAKALSSLRKPGFISDQFLGVRKQASWRNDMNTWWNSLTEGQRLFFPICFANCLVFLAWRIPRLQSMMVRYFCSNPASRIVCWPMVLSTFSHYSALHLLANMYVLHSFSSGAVASLGKEQFLGVYVTAGVISSMSSYIHRAIMKQSALSLGASGAIMGILGYVCTQYPDTKLHIILLPFFTFAAGTAIKVIVAVDAAGVLLGWRFFDHAAHLGGATFGIAWSYWGNAQIWQKREPLLRWWHDLRGTSVK